MADHGKAEYYLLKAPVYKNETLDLKSRNCVRRVLTKKMKTEPWCKWWTGISNVPRKPLVQECVLALKSYWLRNRKYASEQFWTYQAIAEEIDYYLPKIFWKVKRRLNYSASRTYVNPEWSTFSKWHFEYEETKARLAAEECFLQEALEAKERYGKDNEKQELALS